MAAANSPHKRWSANHNPEKRPLGCNGKYGKSGENAHRRRSETVCPKCRRSSNHYRRELKRGQPKPLKAQPCGTNAGARGHRSRGEELCFKCKVAEADYRAELRAKNP